MYGRNFDIYVSCITTMYSSRGDGLIGRFSFNNVKQIIILLGEAWVDVDHQLDSMVYICGLLFHETSQITHLSASKR